MKITISNTTFDRVTMEEAVGRIVQMAQKTDRPRYVCTGNLDHLVMLDKDEHFREVYAGASLVLADGAPIIWLSRLSSSVPLPERVAGSDLVWELGHVSSTTGIRLFFLGGLPGSAEAAADVLRAKFPGTHIAGVYCPPASEFATPEEQERILRLVHAAQPDVLLVGLGAPKQEKWIFANHDALGVPVSIGIGGAFEMTAGVVSRAPRWMQNSGLEWAYRLAQEPTRLWKRYLGNDLPFLLKLTLTTLKRPNTNQNTKQLYPESHDDAIVKVEI
jgi:N-acetylglucosaminyldiphosphoundecaprenol N-acetyl-beta-D-mannosaminyltransferase